MITEQDITKLKEVFVTKDEFVPFKEEMGDFKTEMSEFKEEMADFRVNTAERLEAIEDLFGSLNEKVTTKLDHVLVSLDTLGGLYQHSVDEHRAGGYILGRHTRQLEALSAGTGIVLPD